MNHIDTMKQALEALEDLQRQYAIYPNSFWDWSKGRKAITALREALAEQRKPLTDERLPVTQDLLNEQHPWLYQPMWIAMKDGNVLHGYYEWRQGRNPDRFHTTGDGDGDEWAFDAAYVMPIVKPTPPTIEAAHGIKE